MNSTPRTNCEVYIANDPEKWVPNFEYVSSELAKRLELENTILRKALEGITAGAPTEEPTPKRGDVIRAIEWEHWHLANYAREAFVEIENLNDK